MSASSRRPPFRSQTFGGIILQFLRVLGAPSAGNPQQAHGSNSAVAGPFGPRRVSSYDAPLRIAIAAAVLAVCCTFVGAAWLVQHMPGPRLPAAIPSAATAPVQVLPTVTLPALVVPAGQPLTVLRSFGRAPNGTAQLLQPQEAVAGPAGLTFVADTGNHRVAIFNSAGVIVGTADSSPAGPLQSPFSLTFGPNGLLYLLDSDLGRVISYRLHGTALQPVAISDSAISLVHARSLAVTATGQVLVANPASNSVVTLSGSLTFLRAQTNTLQDGTALFDQPSAVAGGEGGTVFVVDSQHNVVKQFSPAWAVLRTWPLVMTDTLHSPRVLPLGAGRLLISDPQDGKLLVYAPLSSSPQAYTVAGTSGVATAPLGVSATSRGTILVTCSGSSQILEVRIPA